MEDDNIVTEPSVYEAFKHNNGAYYAWVLTSPYMLAVDAPHDDPDCLDEEGNHKELHEFLLSYELVGEDMLISLCKKQGDTRKTKVTEDDLEQWDNFMQMNGIEVSEWLTIADKQQLMETE